MIKEKTGLAERYILLAGVALVFAFLGLTSFGRMMIFNCVCVAYPVYKSFEALKTNTYDDDKKWLTYWVVYGFIMVVEPLFDVLIQMFPYYKPLKLVFFVYLIHGETNGYLQVYHYVLVPLLSQFDKNIEDALENVNKTVGDVTRKVQERAYDGIKNVVGGAMENDAVVRNGAVGAYAKL